MIPLTQEHLEAAQAKANQEREEFLLTLSKADQKQFAAVEKAVKILQKAKVPFYLLPFLTNDPKGFKKSWQWNNMADFIEYDNGGKIKEEFYDFISYFHSSSLYAMLHSATHKKPFSEEQYNAFHQLVDEARNVVYKNVKEFYETKWKNEQ